MFDEDIESAMLQAEADAARINAMGPVPPLDPDDDDDDEDDD